MALQAAFDAKHKGRTFFVIPEIAHRSDVSESTIRREVKKDYLIPGKNGISDSHIAAWLVDRNLRCTMRTLGERVCLEEMLENYPDLS